MNPEFPQNPREELELRVTSLLLGELSEGEAALVREAIANDPELQKLHDELKQTIHLVREATVSAGGVAHEESAPLRLSKKRRKKLRVAFLIPPLKKEHIQEKRRRQWIVPVAVMAAITAIISITIFSGSRRERAFRAGYGQNDVAEKRLSPQVRRITNQPGKRAGEGDGRVQISGQVVTINGGVNDSSAGLSYESSFASAGTPGSPITLGSGPSGIDGTVAVTNSTWSMSSGLRGFYDDDHASAKPATTMPAQKGATLTYQSLESLPAEPKLAPPPTEIVLPKAGDGGGDALQVAGTSGVRTGNDFLSSGGWGSGAGGSLGTSVEDKNGNNQWFGGKFITAGPQNRGEEFGRFKNLGETDSTRERLSEQLGDSKKTATVGAMEEARDRVDVGGAVVGGESGLLRPGASQKALSAPTVTTLAGIQADVELKDKTVDEWPKTPSIRRFGGGPDAALKESAGQKVPVLGDMPLAGRLFRSETNINFGTEQVTIDGRKYAKEFVGYDDPGAFAPQAQSASGGASAGLPLTAQLPLPHYRLRQVEAAPESATTSPADQSDLGLNKSGTGMSRDDVGGLRSLQRKSAEGEGKIEGQGGLGGSNIHSLNIVGYVNVDLKNDQQPGQQTDTNVAVESEWVGVLERPSAPHSSSNKFVGRYAYIATSGEVLDVAAIHAQSKQASDDLFAKSVAPPQVNIAAKFTEVGDSSTRTYEDKKRELDNLVTFQKILEQRLAMEKVDVSLPRTGMVNIMNPARPPAAADAGILGRIGHALKGDYVASASIKVDRGGADIAEFTSRNMSGVYDPYFIQTEFEAIKSDTVLTNVVKALDLENRWGTNRSGGKPLKTQEAVELLRRRLELRPVKNTMFIEIQGKSSNPAEAAELANAVAEAYQSHRLEEIKRASEGGIKALEERFEEQQKKVSKAQQELAALREPTKSVAPAAIIDAPLPRKPATNAPIPQPEILTSENNFSTFSLNVSDVSFKLAAASLEKGQMPDSASIRSEEFINAFDYRDPEAAAGSPVAFAWERARYPFAHNRDLLRFSLKTAAAGRQAGRPLNIVLLLDNSGSMERADRVGIIREAMRVLASQLQAQDKLSVITFARTPRLVADGITGDKAGEVAEQVSGLTPEGGTNLEDAMNLAYQTAAKHYLVSGINRVVVLTDGAANLGNVEPESLKQKVEAQRKQGIALDCFGIGWEGFNDDLLEVLSRNGDGRYGFINSPEEAASEFAGQLAGALKVAASDVKVQVEFNPKRVTSYRQIGYAKHQLTKEQFRDNTVDAAEIAAQEAGNALYTVEVNPAGEGPIGTVRVRYKIPGTTDYREQAWDVPFSGNAVALEQASPTMRLATSASAFSEWLAVSPHAGEVRPDALLNILSGVPEVFGADSRPKKLEWMIRQAKSLEGK